MILFNTFRRASQPILYLYHYSGWHIYHYSGWHLYYYLGWQIYRYSEWHIYHYSGWHLYHYSRWQLYLYSGWHINHYSGWHIYPCNNQLFPCLDLIFCLIITCLLLYQSLLETSYVSYYEGCSINNETGLITFWFAFNWNEIQYYCKI